MMKKAQVNSWTQMILLAFELILSLFLGIALPVSVQKQYEFSHYWTCLE